MIATPGLPPREVARRFYALLRREVVEGNPLLDAEEQELLRKHYPTIMVGGRGSEALATYLYAERRSGAIREITTQVDPVVFDAGCGFGSESFLFAALGAKVVATDLSERQVAIAWKRKPFYESLLEKPLNVEFERADLDNYAPAGEGISLTWIASVLAAVVDQDALMRRIHLASRRDGRIIVTDMNLANPLLLVKEWKRRRRARLCSSAFADHADYAAMIRRSGRRGARSFPYDEGPGRFDDVQFFTPGTIGALLEHSGFTTVGVQCCGFVSPTMYAKGLGFLEALLPRVPIAGKVGYFYTITGVRR